jgi:hypothetical protein
MAAPVVILSLVFGLPSVFPQGARCAVIQPALRPFRHLIVVIVTLLLEEKAKRPALWPAPLGLAFGDRSGAPVVVVEVDPRGVRVVFPSAPWRIAFFTSGRFSGSLGGVWVAPHLVGVDCSKHQI